MAEIPRDPRQLARDILAGKVKIEDLARERQMRGGGRATPQQQARIPLPRQVPPSSPPIPTQPPMQRGPARPPQMPMPQRPMPPQRPIPQQRPRSAPMPPPRQPTGGPVVTVTAPPVVRAVAQRAEAPATTAVRPAPSATQVAGLLRSKQSLRQGILMAEILGKPKALRKDEM